jgi:biotin synthase-related radical SAM superfamily protein
MKKLYEILVAYKDGGVALIKLPKEEIDGRIQRIISQGRQGKLYVIAIDTLKGTALVNDAEKVICYYDQPALAEIVIQNNKLNLEARQDRIFYIEKTIKELEF